MSEKLIKAIKLAKDSLKDLGLDDVEKQVAMAKAIDYFLKHEDKETVSDNATTNYEIGSKNEVKTDSGKNPFWSELSLSSEVAEERLKDIYSIKESQINLIIPKVKGENAGEKQCHLALLVLYAYMKGLQMEWVPSTLLTESVKEMNVHDSNLSRNLEKDWFRKTGTGKGVKYRLSTVGVSEAKSYLGSL